MSAIGGRIKHWMAALPDCGPVFFEAKYALRFDADSLQS
jgi:hypothetical protein